MWESGDSAGASVEKLGLKQENDPAKLQSIIDDVIAKNGGQVDAYKGGKVQLFGFFVGQVMAATKGQANPKLVNEMLKKALG